MLGGLASAEEKRFAFGANWRKFHAALSEQQREAARISLTEWPGDLQGRSFLDIGAGSSLFAAAADELGANVRAFDYDPASPAVERGDVLDRDFMESLGHYDIVYAWGVLHHTGEMWAALANTLGTVAPGGVALIAVYNRPRAAPLQVTMKRAYNRSPRPIRAAIKAAWGVLWITARTIVKRQNPVRFVRNYGERHRGMTFWRDVEDWVGGWPFAYTSRDELLEHLPSDFALKRSRVAPPGGCNEYLLIRRSARDHLATQPLLPVPDSFT